ncbi:BTB/POZ domain-containing protein [Citrus sinensis]|nr:BTB/POZ domain-containing protein [Citrus sinensis]
MDPRPFRKASARFCDMKEQEDDDNDDDDGEMLNKKKLEFLGGFDASFREQTPYDMLLFSDDKQPPLPAHKAILSARSNYFKKVINKLSDGTRKLPENREELKLLLDFLYTGSLPEEKLEKHSRTLYRASQKYEIGYLMEICERYFLRSLNPSNALEYLSIADVRRNQALMAAALGLIVKNMDGIAFTKEYEDFASKYPDLSVLITRELLNSKTSLGWVK